MNARLRFWLAAMSVARALGGFGSRPYLWAVRNAGRVSDFGAPAAPTPRGIHRAAAVAIETSTRQRAAALSTLLDLLSRAAAERSRALALRDRKHPDAAKVEKLSRALLDLALQTLSLSEATEKKEC